MEAKAIFSWEKKKQSIPKSSCVPFLCKKIHKLQLTAGLMDWSYQFARLCVMLSLSPWQPAVVYYTGRWPHSRGSRRCVTGLCRRASLLFHTSSQCERVMDIFTSLHQTRDDSQEQMLCSRSLEDDFTEESGGCHITCPSILVPTIAPRGYLCRCCLFIDKKVIDRDCNVVQVSPTQTAANLALPCWATNTLVTDGNDSFQSLLWLWFN